MNKTSKIITALLVVVAIVIIASISMSKGSNPGTTGTPATTGTDTTVATTTPVAVSETKKLSGSLSQYQNDELGFALKYPNDWEREEGNAGVIFLIPVDQSQTSTVSTLTASVQVFSGTCAFPPVTTIKDRSTVKVGTNSLNMISMSNTVQGRVYFNRMYCLQKDKTYYMFSFASVAANPTTKGLTGSNVTVAQNNNKAIVNTADAAFTDMVKSFSFVASAQGQDETQASPKK